MPHIREIPKAPWFLQLGCRRLLPAPDVGLIISQTEKEWKQNFGAKSRTGTAQVTTGSRPWLYAIAIFDG